MGVYFGISSLNKKNAILLGGPRGRRTKNRCWMVARRTHVLGRELWTRHARIPSRRSLSPRNGDRAVAPGVEPDGISKFHTTRAYRAIAVG